MTTSTQPGLRTRTTGSIVAVGEKQTNGPSGPTGRPGGVAGRRSPVRRARRGPGDAPTRSGPFGPSPRRSSPGGAVGVRTSAARRRRAAAGAQSGRLSDRLSASARRGELQQLPPDAVCTALGNSPEGFTPQEVARRRARFGPNHLPRAPGRGVWRRVAAQMSRTAGRRGERRPGGGPCSR
ncbi:cation-transporting P-type ATPase [Streptomyces kronopolitis]|uniref:cation-transporting P-type ATPase n=1 Tax=Streptomyces kronopolitis TaxID=1612435 RepID=UPI0036A73C41